MRDVTRMVSRTTAGSIRSPTTKRSAQVSRGRRTEDPAHAKMPCHPIPSSGPPLSLVRKEEKTSVADAKSGAVCSFIRPPTVTLNRIALRKLNWNASWPLSHGRKRVKDDGFVYTHHKFGLRDAGRHFKFIREMTHLIF